MTSLLMLVIYVIILITQIDTRMTCGSSPVFDNFYYYTIAVVVYIIASYLLVMGLLPEGLKSIQQGKLLNLLPIASIVSLVVVVGHAAYYFMNRDEIKKAQCKYQWINTFSDISIGTMGGLVLISVAFLAIFHKRFMGIKTV
jgi:hypothetical protein